MSLAFKAKANLETTKPRILMLRGNITPIPMVREGGIDIAIKRF